MSQDVREVRKMAGSCWIRGKTGICGSGDWKSLEFHKTCGVHQNKGEYPLVVNIAIETGPFTLELPL